MITLPVAVDQVAVNELSPDTHSALMSEYTWTECVAPSVEAADTAMYAKGIDCFTKSVGCKSNQN